jgi:hypothetical protein
MKYILTITRFYFAALLVTTIGLSASGCRDSVSISEATVDVPLSSLTVTPGTLQPAFSRNITSYLVEVATTVSTVTVTATPQNSTATMSINGVDTNPGQGRRITLNSSATTTNITIVLTSQNGLESTYDVLVRKVDNTLSALSVTPPGIFPPPGFNPSTLTYQVEVASGVSSVAVVATKTDVHAVMSGSVTAAAGIATGKATIRLNGPGQPTVVSITVAVPNGEAKTYIVTVNRLSGDNRLKDLTVTPGTFDHPFDPAITNYTVDVTSDVDKVTIKATKSDINASMSGSLTAGPGIESDTQTLFLGGQGTETEFLITVAAPDSAVQPKIYHIIVKRAASSNNTLSSLIVTADRDYPIDLNSQQPYTVDVPTAVISVTVRATLEDTNATLEINHHGTSSGVPSAPITLGDAGSDTDIPVVVTAPNGNQKNYPIRVHRAAPSSNANLSALLVTADPLVNPSDHVIDLTSPQPYPINVAANVAIVTVTATLEDINATLTIDTVGALSGQPSHLIFLGSPGSDKDIPVVVKAVDGTLKTYIIRVHVEELAPPPPP